MPEAIILDLDSTLLNTYGKQEDQVFNYHYQSNGYHPLVCYDGITGDLIKIQLRDGTQYLLWSSSFVTLMAKKSWIVAGILSDQPDSIKGVLHC